MLVWWRILHRYASTNKRRYPQQPLHRAAFMRKCSYRERFVHREAFTHRRLYTQRLSCKEAFTKKKYTDALHYTKILLHSAAFTHRRLYTQTLEHRRFHRHRNFYTEKPLHRTAFTQRISSPPQKLANRYSSLFFFFRFLSFPFQPMHANGWYWDIHDIHVSLFVLWIHCQHSINGMTPCATLFCRRRRYAQQPLHRAAFIRTCSYTERFAQRETLTYRRLYTQRLLRKQVLTHRSALFGRTCLAVWTPVRFFASSSRSPTFRVPLPKYK